MPQATELALPRLPTAPRVPLNRPACPAARDAYFVGLGGAGMQALATVLAGRHGRVRGSERSAASRQKLRQLGWQVDADADHRPLPTDCQLVVYSDAVPHDHPQRQAARRAGIPQQSYARTLGRLMNGRQGMAVAGTHGKSTITAMTAQILTNAQKDPSFVCGAGPVAGSQTGGRSGEGPLLLAEACEYRKNFLQLRPHAAVVSGIELDHFETYHSIQQLKNSFAAFVRQIDPQGLLVLPADCSAARQLRQAAGCRVETYGFDERADWRAVRVTTQAGRYAFEIMHRDLLIGRACLQVPGRHNVLNALAAAALAGWGKVCVAEIVQGLCQFRGLRRRLQPGGTFCGVHLWDDFAHHPTEVAAALATLREIHPKSRLCCVFQPHQASRTARLMHEFARSLQNADLVAVASIYRAREGRWRPGEPTAADLAAAVRSYGTPTLPAHTFKEIQRQLTCCPGDVLVTLGAGPVWRFHHAFTNRI
ncbi:MAG: UDP-N-acetylmuramate--L-alanine ligase [Planctomycetales bacterium]|nr:UDP-N-acetylmuramate--L-alanine ligase [Planctomycetales bacterium]NIM09943.1 UDP-N-acetylmuramate--L-alanine ligase [Planctomycetales bacterium]NIN09383.1 UDP-N-acetylmuramate--L-alanine ligase [Planctomycetales bacterium]NIN78490.1 UDP-N-acetylmuramate--L-alanine ligase [Planctomycetales bacterium]NIO35682.1 UDP-N-acetylmuramate--L-alanine ligase [Planctomycetales bacterium]